MVKKKTWNISVFSFFYFFSFGFRASGIICIWSSIEKMFLRSIFVPFFLLSLFSLFFSFFSLVWRNNVKQMKTRKKKCFKEITYMLQGCSWCDVLWENLRLFALWWHSGSQSFVWSVVARFHVNFSAHPCRLQPMVLGPCGLASLRGPPMMAASMFGQAFALLVPWHCFDGSMRYVAKRDNDMGSWCAFFVRCFQTSDNRMASVVKTKSVDRLQIEQIKQDEANMVKPFEFDFFLCIY